MQIKTTGPGTPAARLLVIKRQADQPLRSVNGHQCMPRRVKLYSIDHTPAGIKTLQNWPMLIGQTGQLPGMPCTQLLGIRLQLRQPRLSTCTF